MRRALILILTLGAVTCQAQRISTSLTRWTGPGRGHTNLGIGAVIAGGSTNRIESRLSVINGGARNAIYGTGDADRASAIGGGEYNTITNGSAHSTILAGLSNVIDNARYAFIGAWHSKIYGEAAGGASNAGILSGWAHTNELVNSVIDGGWRNAIYYTNTVAVADQRANSVGGGWDNTIIGGEGATIPGGYENVIQSILTSPAEGTTIGGGYRNVAIGAYGGTIGGGTFNTLGTGGGGLNDAVIAGGSQNTVGASQAAISGGTENLNTGQLSSIGGGQLNATTGGWSFTGGGFANSNNAGSSVIGGGDLNFIAAGADYSVIPGGQNNRVTAASAWAFGSNQTNATTQTMIWGFNATNHMSLTSSGFGIRTPIALVSHGLQTIAANGAVLANASRVRVAGSGGPITLNATTSIADGTEGQLLYIYGTSDANTVAVPDGSNVQTAGGVTRTLGNRDVLVLMFDTTNGDWAEVSFSNN